VGLSELSQIEERLHGSLTSRQQWILGTRRQQGIGAPIAVAGEEDEPCSVDVVDPTPSQETQIADEEELTRLRKRVESLPPQERLLLQLRFEQELSLDEIARLCGLQDAQRAHRTLATVLKKLRHALK
jgi:RNA polymerase sigma factor (sigma-70 family)